jgi:hypothetical protein
MSTQINFECLSCLFHHSFECLSLISCLLHDSWSLCIFVSIIGNYCMLTLWNNIKTIINLCFTLLSMYDKQISAMNYCMICFPCMQSTALGSTPLKVTQYHFTGWPDHGVPQNGVNLINFIKRVRMAHPYSDSRPLLVHCSAGVGRTGAFIVLDSMLQRMQVEENLNIYEFFKQLRAQRVLMVQTQVLYHKNHSMHSLHAHVVLITLCIPFSQQLSSSFLQ